MRIAMPFVTAGRENSAAIRIYYEDHGSGSPVVLVHGYAQNGHSWEKQEAALLAAGYRVITYDRRGFGASSRPSTGYDFGTLAGDLHVLLSRLDLRDVVLAGFAMGTGEVTRYLAVHGPGRVTAAVLVAPLLPFLLKTHDNPDGVDRSVFDALTARIAADRPAAMKDFMDRSYSVDLLGGDRVSDQAWQNSFYVAISASAHAALGCVTACLEDFRADLAAISVPVLVIQGDQDRVLPYEATGSRLPALLTNARCVVIAGGPHAIIWTHADEVNQALLDFIGHPGRVGRRHSGPCERPASASVSPARVGRTSVTAAGAYLAIRSNSLPSMSAKVVHRDLSRWTSRSLSAPKLSRRSVSASKVSLTTSRCRRFLTVFGSGTLLNTMRGPLVSPGSRTACSEVGSSATGRPRTSAQNPARVAASAQSKVTASSEVVKAGISFREASAMRAYARMRRGLRGGSRTGRNGGRDPAPFPLGRRAQMAVRPPSAAMTAPVT
jgi:non-heme chloroperoxidase